MATYKGHNITFVSHDPTRGTFDLINDVGELVELVDTLHKNEFKMFPQLKGLPHGKYRRTRKAASSGPAGKPYTSFTWQNIAIGTVVTFNFSSGTVVAEEPKPIENAGIRAGEIIGHRCWRIVNGRLHSTYMQQFEWKPGEPMTGDVRKEYGVHAFNDQDYLKIYGWEMRCHHRMQWDFEHYFFSGSEVPTPSIYQPLTLAFGTVALWGEVIEHEHGYRAEFAKILTLDRVDGCGPEDMYELAKLKRYYNV